MYGKELKLDRDSIIKLNKDFHGFVEEEDNEPEFIESDLGDIIINPKYNTKNELKDLEAKLKKCEEEYNIHQHPYYIHEINTLKEKINNCKTDDTPSKKPTYDINNAFTPAFIDFFCKKFGISHYADDINKFVL